MPLSNIYGFEIPSLGHYSMRPIWKTKIFYPFFLKKQKEEEESKTDLVFLLEKCFCVCFLMDIKSRFSRIKSYKIRLKKMLTWFDCFFLNIYAENALKKCWKAEIKRFSMMKKTVQNG